MTFIKKLFRRKHTYELKYHMNKDYYKDIIFLKDLNTAAIERFYMKLKIVEIAKAAGVTIMSVNLHSDYNCASIHIRGYESNKNLFFKAINDDLRDKVIVDSINRVIM